ncbi:MAG: sigma-70 family RNA polymerase sigma factor [Planctomycetota bacterium]|jgi:DNA-directed RNA polymerase specialized sigma24 family protein
MTFEQVKPALFKWAGRFQSNRFEFWELINAVWEKNVIQQLHSHYLAPLVIKREMIDYMRHEYDLRRVRKVLNWDFKGRKAIALVVHNNWELQSPTSPDFTLRADEKDITNYLTNHDSLSRMEKFILKLKFIEGMKTKDIAKSAGVKPSWVYERIRESIRRLRAVTDKEKVLGVA